MDYKILNELGSFKAWGVGFIYEYDAEFGILDIIDTRDERPLIYLDIDQNFGQAALQYTKTLDKSLQVCALSLSNNTSIDLTDLLDHGKLPPILQRVAQIARYCFDLERRKYKSFSMRFTQELDYAKVKIQCVKSTPHSPQFYIASCKAHTGHVTKVRHEILCKTLATLSESIVQDLVMRLSLVSSDDQLQKLLNAASDIFAISCILNPRFKPGQINASGGTVRGSKLHVF